MRGKPIVLFFPALQDGTQQHQGALLRADHLES